MSYSKSVYFIPVWFDRFEVFTQAMDGSELWTRTGEGAFDTAYLLHYAAALAHNGKLFRSYTLGDISKLNIYMFRDKPDVKIRPQLEQVRFSCFATGVGFMEFWLSYGDATPEEVAGFAYLFKKAVKRKRDVLPDGERALYDVARSLMPDGAPGQIFFSATKDYKYECNCYHFIHRDSPLPGDEELENILCHLSRSYKGTMPATCESAYDMTYGASGQDHWSGCTEGLANVLYDCADTSENAYYLHELKPQHLAVDYYFMYLLLLNQKYTAIEYIQMVATAMEGTHKEVEKLNRRIVMLKNTFSFNVISDDRVFQNIYAKMYGVLEIKNLLADVIENEGQMEFLLEAQHIQADRRASKYLAGISVLSLFSALIDSASYFDRFPGIRTLATGLSLACVLITAITCIILVCRGGKSKLK